MSSRRRSELKNYFIKGRIPKEEDFQDLIDSTLNLLDDSIDASEEDGVVINPKSNNALFTFRTDEDDENAFWRINLEKDDKDDEYLRVKFSQNDSSILSLGKDGKVGIGIEKPLHELDINGLTGSHGRINYYRFGEVPADGQWHNIVENISNYSAFEVMAACGEKGAHAITHAIAVCTYGKSRGGINQTQNYFGRSRNRIQLRWNGEYFNYTLQIRSIRPYAKETNIKYNVGSLWD